MPLAELPSTKTVARSFRTSSRIPFDFELLRPTLSSSLICVVSGESGRSIERVGGVEEEGGGYRRRNNVGESKTIVGTAIVPDTERKQRRKIVLWKKRFPRGNDRRHYGGQD